MNQALLLADAYSVLVAVPLILLVAPAYLGIGQKPAAGAAVVPWIDTTPSGLHQGLATPVAWVGFDTVTERTARDLRGFHWSGWRNHDRHHRSHQPFPLS